MAQPTSTTRRESLSQIFKAAWTLFKSAAAGAFARFGEALKAAWAAARAAATTETLACEASNWAVEIVREGIDTGAGARRRRSIALTTDEQGRIFTVSSITATGGEVTVMMHATAFADCPATATVTVEEGEQFDPFHLLNKLTDAIRKAVGEAHGPFAAAKI